MFLNLNTKPTNAVQVVVSLPRPLFSQMSVAADGLFEEIGAFAWLSTQKTLRGLLPETEAWRDVGVLLDEERARLERWIARTIGYGECREAVSFCALLPVPPIGGEVDFSALGKLCVRQAMELMETLDMLFKCPADGIRAGWESEWEAGLRAKGARARARFRGGAECPF